MKPRIKTFDAVEMKHAAQTAFQARIAGKTREEELAFYRAIERAAVGTRDRPNREDRDAGERGVE